MVETPASCGELNPPTEHHFVSSVSIMNTELDKRFLKCQEEDYTLDGRQEKRVYYHGLFQVSASD